MSKTQRNTQILEDCISGMSRQDIANKYQLTSKTVGHILQRQLTKVINHDANFKLHTKAIDDALQESEHNADHLARELGNARQKLAYQERRLEKSEQEALSLYDQLRRIRVSAQHILHQQKRTEATIERGEGTHRKQNYESVVNNFRQFR